MWPPSRIGIVGILLNELQPHDLLKFGLIPELIGRLPVITTLRALNRDQLVEILTEPKNALVQAVPEAVGVPIDR